MLRGSWKGFIGGVGCGLTRDGVDSGIISGVVVLEVFNGANLLEPGIAEEVGLKEA